MREIVAVVAVVGLCLLHDVLNASLIFDFILKWHKSTWVPNALL